MATALQYLVEMLLTLSSGYVQQARATGTPIGVFYGVFFTATDGTPTFSKVWTGGTATQGSVDADCFSIQ